MVELYEAAFSSVNVVYSTLLIVICIYWLIVVLGVIDLDALDLNLDVDADVDPGLDVDADGDVGAATTEGGFSWLAYFNVAEVPIMFFATIVVLVMWIVSIEVNRWLDSWNVVDYRGWLAVALAVPNFVFALHVAKFLLYPVKHMSRRRQQITRLDGKTCLVTTLEVNGEFGRCEMPKAEGSLILEARTRGGEVLKKGDPATVVEHVEEGSRGYYVVTRQTWK